MTTIATLFKNGRSQAVRLPREFRFEGDRVRVRRAGRGVLVEPMFTDVSAWFAELDRLATQPFMPEGRQQPPRRSETCSMLEAARFSVFLTGDQTLSFSRTSRSGAWALSYFAPAATRSKTCFPSFQRR